ncbi:unnamed protein product, partial [Didymodactylos carnosus]
MLSHLDQKLQHEQLDYGLNLFTELIPQVNSSSNLNYKNYHGETLFMEICALGYTKLVEKLLLMNNSIINEINCNGENALFYAVEYADNIQIIDLLLESKINVNILTNNGYSIIHKIIQIGHSSNLEYLLITQLNIIDINRVDQFGKSYLMYACEYSNLEIINILLQSGVNITLRDNN